MRKKPLVNDTWKAATWSALRSLGKGRIQSEKCMCKPRCKPGSMLSHRKPIWRYLDMDMDIQCVPLGRRIVNLEFICIRNGVTVGREIRPGCLIIP